MGGCMKKCDKIEPFNIKENDYSINYCLQFGFCGESLGNICKVMEEKGETSQNSLLNQYCSLRKSKSKKPVPQPSNEEQVKSQRNLTKLKSEINKNLNDSNYSYSNDSYSNNIGVFSVVIIIVLLCIFMINSKK
jgi:hypothetical protein